MKAVVYLRVSTEDQAEKGYSIQAQKDECSKKAFELGCGEEDILIYSDEGVSGAVLERPQLMAALDILKKRGKEICYFICYDSSRLSRNAAHQLIIVDEIKKSGTQLVFIRNSFQDNAEGRFQLTVMAAVDEYERARLRLRTEMGKRAKAGQGKLTHNPGLYGYDFDSKTDTLSINEGQKEILLKMYTMLTEEHYSPSAIAEKLNTAGIPSPRMKLWNRVTVRRILSNPSYLGILYIRRYDTRDCHLNKFRSKGEKIRVREKPRQDWVPVQIPQMIDEAVWEKAQVILKKTKQKYEKDEKSGFILNTFLKCGICGSRLNGKKISKGSRSYCYYICTGKYSDKAVRKCESGLVNAGQLETEVWRQICKRINGYIDDGLNAEKLIEAFICNEEADDRNINIKKEKAMKEKDRIITMFQKGFINEAETVKRLSSVEKMLGDLDSVSARNKILAEELPIWIEKCELKENLPYIMKEMLNILDSNSRKQVMEQLVSEIIIVFPDETTLVGDVPESYITVPEGDIPNYTPTNDPFDKK